MSSNQRSDREPVYPKVGDKIELKYGWVQDKGVQYILVCSVKEVKSKFEFTLSVDDVKVMKETDNPL